MNVNEGKYTIIMRDALPRGWREASETHACIPVETLARVCLRIHARVSDEAHARVSLPSLGGLCGPCL